MWKTLVAIVALLVVSAISAAPPAGRVSVAPAVLSHEACKVPFQNIGSGCYYFGAANLKNNWWEAAEYCRIIGGNLLTIEDPVENEYIQDHLLRNYPQSRFFIGGYDLGHEGIWYWQATLRHIDFFDWGAGQPNNDMKGDIRGQNCMTLNVDYGFRWDDDYCHLTDNRTYGFICET